MKKVVRYEEENVTTTVYEFFCNKCGGSCLGDAGRNVEGLHEVVIHCGYGSQYFDDMTRLRFSICEKCLFEDAKTWVHDPRDGEYEIVAENGHLYER